MTLITPSYTYRTVKVPTPGSMTEWYANEFVAKSSAGFSITLGHLPLTVAYDLLKLFGAFAPLWVE
jgi:hypothetical protein